MMKVELYTIGGMCVAEINIPQTPSYPIIKYGNAFFVRTYSETYYTPRYVEANVYSIPIYMS